MRRLLYILLVIMLISCGNGSKPEIIVKAESLLEEHPYSAYKMLTRAYTTLKDFKRSDRMAYLLIYAEAMNKAYVPMDTVKFMNDVLDYYDLCGNRKEKMAANYMMGCVYRDKCNSPKAIQYYKSAVSKADTTDNKCDYLLLNRIYGQMASLYMEQRYPSKELESWTKGRKYALLGKDTLSAVQYLEKSGNAYLLRGDRHSFMSCIDSAINEYMRYGYPQYAAACQIHKVKIYLEEGNINKAGNSLRIYREKSGLINADGTIQSGCEFYYYYQGKYLNESGNPKAALGYFYKLLQYKSDIQNIENAYKGLMEAYYNIGNTDSLSKYSKLYAQANDSANIKNSAMELIRMQFLYNYNESQQNLIEKTRESKNLWRIVFFLFIAALIMSSIIIRYFKKRRVDIKEIKDGYRKTLALLRKTEAELVEFQNDRESFKKQKENEVEHLKQQLSSYNENFRISDWASEQSILHHAIVEHLRKLAGKGVAMSASEWDDLVETIKKIMSEFYTKIECSKFQLTDQEFKVCILVRLKFSSTDISNLLGTSQQRVTNIKSSINIKLFHQKGSKYLFANLSHM